MQCAGIMRTGPDERRSIEASWLKNASMIVARLLLAWVLTNQMCVVIHFHAPLLLSEYVQED